MLKEEQGEKMLTDKETLDLINEKNDKLFIKQLKKRLSKMPKEEFERSKKYLEKRGYKLIEMDKKEIKKILDKIPKCASGYELIDYDPKDKNDEWMIDKETGECNNGTWVYTEKTIKKTLEKEIKKIFQEIDLIIQSCKSEKPVPFEDSRFKKLYNKLKEKYEIKENG
jgi:hypothetical protein